MKAFSLVLSTLAVTVALAAPAAAQGRGEGAQGSTAAHTPKVTPPPPAPISVPPSLAAKIEPLLPTGTSVATASTGFKNLGQFIAAVHVSKNLDIPFDTLKAKVTGTSAVSLGQAIKTLKPTADSSAEVKKAQQEAKADQSGKG